MPQFPLYIQLDAMDCGVALLLEPTSDFYAHADEKADKDHLLQDAKKANIQDIIDRLLLGYNTKIRSGGSWAESGAEATHTDSTHHLQEPRLHLFR